MKERGIKSLSDIIQNSNSEELEKLRTVALRFKVVEEFPEIFSEFKEFVEPVKLNKKILSLRVENSVMRSELNLLQDAIIEKINKHYNKEVVNKIKFV